MPLPLVNFTAKRSLVAGVSASASISYSIPVAYAGINREHRVMSTQRRSLSGKRETYYESEENAWSIQTIPLTASAQASLVMFLDSVERGETFTFVPPGMTSVSAVMDRTGYTESRNPQNDSRMGYSFTIVEVP